MNRIVVIGPPGAGKTYFSRLLSNKTKLPIIHLDYHYHDKNNDYENNPKEWSELVKDLAKKQKWIMEGNYKATTFDIRLPLADKVIILDYPRYICLWRVLKRRIQFNNKKRSEMPSEWKEKLDPEFIKYVWNYHKKDRPEVFECLKKFRIEDRKILLKNQKQTKEFLKTL